MYASQVHGLEKKMIGSMVPKNVDVQELFTLHFVCTVESRYLKVHGTVAKF